MKITAEFVTGARQAADFPGDGLPEIALVGRSNVGKSSLINALVRIRVARTSARPGKTREANVYRVTRGSRSMYLVDLPGYGYAPGMEEFDEVARAYFEGPSGRAERARKRHGVRNALLLMDARHPGLANDRAAWRWLHSRGHSVALVVTKIDKLARGQRIRTRAAFESVFEDSVLPVSAVTGEGLDELWKLMDRLANTRNPSNRSLPPRTREAEGAAVPTR